MKSKNELIQTLGQLAPWHHSIVLNQEGLRTVDGNKQKYDDPNLNNVRANDSEIFKSFLKRAFPEGLEGKSVLDVACNGGGDSIAAHQLGADFVFGFDARNHWLNQCAFLKDHFNIPDSQMAFRLGGIEEVLPTLDRFDICFFKGIFYHLPNPVHVLLEIARKTNELLLVDTAYRNDIPPFSMAPKYEGVTQVMSGVDGLSWYPGGPEVLQLILRSEGFKYYKIVYQIRNTSATDTRKFARRPENIGRFRVLFTKEKNSFPRIKPVIRETWR